MPKFKIGDKVKIKNVSSIYGRAYNGFEGIVVAIYNYSKYLVSLYTPITIILLDESMLEPVTTNNKDDNSMKMPKLETGMIVITEDENIGVVADNIVYYMNGNYDETRHLEYDRTGYVAFILRYKQEYKKGLKYIAKYLPNIKANKSVHGIQVLYRYEEPIPEVTMEEVYKKFGHKVKIVPEK